MYIILTSKPGQYRTEPAPGMRPVEQYDYLLCGKKRAEFVLAEMTAEGKVTVIEEGEGGAVNHVPSKFLPRFPTIEQARSELRHLAGFGTLEIELVRVA
ncbi:MAG: ferredoxin [Burkholderiaceae bacterium]